LEARLPQDPEKGKDAVGKTRSTGIQLCKGRRERHPQGLSGDFFDNPSRSLSARQTGREQPRQLRGSNRVVSRGVLLQRASPLLDAARSILPPFAGTIWLYRCKKSQRRHPPQKIAYTLARHLRPNLYGSHRTSIHHIEDFSTTSSIKAYSLHSYTESLSRLWQSRLRFGRAPFKYATCTSGVVMGFMNKGDVKKHLSLRERNRNRAYQPASHFAGLSFLGQKKTVGTVSAEPLNQPAVILPLQDGLVGMPSGKPLIVLPNPAKTAL